MQARLVVRGPLSFVHLHKNKTLAQVYHADQTRENGEGPLE